MTRGASKAGQCGPRRCQAWLGYALVLPSMIAFFLFYIYPVLYSLYLSFYSWDMMQPMRWLPSQSTGGIPRKPPT